jgi:hypothetical protein
MAMFIKDSAGAIWRTIGFSNEQPQARGQVLFPAGIKRT